MSEKNYVDTLILEALRNDDEKALNHLFEQYYNRLYRVGLKTGTTSDTVEENIQIVYMELWKYRKTLGDIQSFEAYLITALKRSIARASQKSHTLKTVNEDFSNAEAMNKEVAFSIESYEAILIKQETSDKIREQVRQNLNQLTTRQKEIVVMKYFDELSYDEISERTGLQKDSLYKILHEAIRRLKTLWV